MRDYYQAYLDALYNALVADVRLDPAQTDAVRFIAQLIPGNWISRAGFPVVQAYIVGKPQEEHKAIGYGPFNRMDFNVSVQCVLPGDYTPALLTDLGLSNIEDEEDLNKALYRITEVAEEVMRESANRRLGVPSPNDTNIFRPNGVSFRIDRASMENVILARADISCFVEYRLVP